MHFRGVTIFVTSNTHSLFSPPHRSVLFIIADKQEDDAPGNRRCHIARISFTCREI